MGMTLKDKILLRERTYEEARQCCRSCRHMTGMSPLCRAAWGKVHGDAFTVEPSGRCGLWEPIKEPADG